MYSLPRIMAVSRYLWLLPVSMGCVIASPATSQIVNTALQSTTSSSSSVASGTVLNLSANANVALSAAEWTSAMSKVTPGTIIDLGTRRVIFSRIRGLHDVTIRGGVFGFTTLDQWKNVTFDGTRFEASAADRATNGVWYIDAYQPDGLTVKNATFVGYLDAKGNLASQSINARGGQNLTIVGNTFRDLANFITIARTVNVTVSDNDMSNVREGVRFVGTTNVLALRNRIGPFRPAIGDHADGIQMFTASLTGPTDHGARNTTITDNLIIASGQGRAQGIFARDELNLWQSGRGYDGMTIINNLLVGTGWHGITIGENASNVMIDSNKLLIRVGGDSVTNNWIMMTNDTSSTLKSNQAGSYILKGSYQMTSNKTVSTPASASETAAAIAAWDAKFRPGRSYPAQ